GKNSLNRLIRCVCGKKIGPDPRNFNQRVSLGRNDLLIRTFLSSLISMVCSSDLLGFIPVSIYETYKEPLKLKRLEPPFELPELKIYMLYSRSSLNSTVFSTFIEKMHKLCVSPPSA
ncbi:hypothetical protein U0Y86_20475, partial [Enterobacter hormaechei]